MQGTRILQQLQCFGLTGEQALADAQQALAQVAELHRTLVALEQQHAEAFLQLAHLVGHRWLGEEEFLGGPGEAAVFGHRVKGLQLRLRDGHGAPRNRFF